MQLTRLMSRMVLTIDRHEAVLTCGTLPSCKEHHFHCISLAHLCRPLKVLSFQGGFSLSSRATRAASSAGLTKFGMVWWPCKAMLPPAVRRLSSVCLHEEASDAARNWQLHAAWSHTMCSDRAPGCDILESRRVLRFWGILAVSVWAAWRRSGLCCGGWLLGLTDCQSVAIQSHRLLALLPLLPLNCCCARAWLRSVT